jgi:hypothetical protein
MKKKMKNLMTITTIIVFSIIAVASTEDKPNENNDEVTYDPMTDADGDPSDTYEYSEKLDEWTVYHSYKPNVDVSNCDSKTCDWCGNEYYAERIKFTEIPNTSNLAQMGNIIHNENTSTTIFSPVGELAIDDDLIDYENRTITTDWEYNCVYYSLEYCSKKCENQAR